VVQHPANGNRARISASAVRTTLVGFERHARLDQDLSVLAGSGRCSRGCCSFGSTIDFGPRTDWRLLRPANSRRYGVRGSWMGALHDVYGRSAHRPLSFSLSRVRGRSGLPRANFRRPGDKCLPRRRRGVCVAWRINTSLLLFPSFGSR